MDKSIHWTVIITSKEGRAPSQESDTLVFETFRPWDDSTELIPAFDGKVLACKGVTERGVEFRLVDPNGL